MYRYEAKNNKKMQHTSLLTTVFIALELSFIRN
jgi:hypothetical protein